MKNYFSKYIDYNIQVNLIGLQTGLLALCFILYHLFFSAKNIYLNSSVLGILLTSIMMSATYHGHHSIERNIYGLFTALFSGLSYAFGAYTGFSLFQTSLVIFFFFPWVGLIDTRNTLFFWMLFYICDAYIIGFGVSHEHIALHAVISYALYYMWGGSLFILSGFIRIYFLKLVFKLRETQPYTQNIPLFCWENYRVIFALGMTTSVLFANYLSHLSTSRLGFWLTMSTFILFKYDHSVSLLRSWNRIIGTFLGCILTFIIFYFFGGKLFLIFFIFPFLYLTVIANSKHYASYTFFLTVTVILVTGMNDQYELNLISIRLLDTLIAVFSVSFVLLILKKLSIQPKHF